MLETLAIELPLMVASAVPTAPPAAEPSLMEAGLWVAVPLFILGMLLIMAEVFIPSGGALSVLAACSVIGSVVFAFFESANVGLGFIGAVLVGTPIMLAVAFKLFPNTPIGRRMIATRPELTDAERSAAVNARLEALVGQIGVANTMLRPSGSAEFSGDSFDVVTRGEMLEKGTRVQVVEVVGNRIVVKEVS